MYPRFIANEGVHGIKPYVTLLMENVEVARIEIPTTLCYHLLWL